MNSTQRTDESFVVTSPAHAMISARCGACEARHSGLCDTLADHDFQYLAHAAHWQLVPKGRVFAVEGELSRQFFNINHGTVKLFKDLPDGRRQIVAFAGPGDFVGLAADQHYSFSAEAINEVRLCSFDRTELGLMFSRFPALEQRLSAMASSHLVVALAHMLLLGRKTSIERVATFLLEWRTASTLRSDHHALALPMSRTDIGDYLGMTIETVSRSLTILKNRHLIAIATDHGISIVDRPRLSDIAGAIPRHEYLSAASVGRGIRN